jgi:hypothetical protein
MVKEFNGLLIFFRILSFYKISLHHYKNHGGSSSHFYECSSLKTSPLFPSESVANKTRKLKQLICFPDSLLTKDVFSIDSIQGSQLMTHHDFLGMSTNTKINIFFKRLKQTGWVWGFLYCGYILSVIPHSKSLSSLYTVHATRKSLFLFGNHQL